MSEIMPSFIQFLGDFLCQILMAEPFVYLVGIAILCWIVNIFLILCGREVK